MRMKEDRRKKTIWIRADANAEIASGHLMRMLSVAESLRRFGAGVCFVLADDTSREWLERLSGTAEPFQTEVLGIPYGNAAEELPLLAELLQREGQRGDLPDWIFVDSYAVTQQWLEALRRICMEAADAEKSGWPRIAFMDDAMAFDPPADLVINYDPDAGELEKFYRAAPRRLLGAQYAPLRQQFVGLTPAVQEDIRRVLISTGGTDPYGMGETLENILRDAAEEQGISLELVHMGPGYPRIQEAACFMTACDLAVSAAGTTLYELCAAGVPTLAFSMADNQTLFAGKMAQTGAVDYLGDVRDASVREGLWASVTDWLTKRLAEGKEKRLAQAGRMHALTDGNGALCIAEALLQADETLQDSAIAKAL